MNTYWSTFIVGLGEVVNDQLVKDLEDFYVELILDGLIVFKTSANIERVKDLRYLNNSFLLLKQYKQLLPEAPIEFMTKSLLADTLPNISTRGRTFRIVFSFANETVSVQKKLLGKLEEKIVAQYKLSVDRTGPNQEFWILYREERYGFFGLRLTKHPDWKTVLAKGQLRPELANLLCLISEPNKSDVVLDPFAGAGAIANERKHLLCREIISGDIKPVRKNIRIIDATDMTDVKAGSVDKIITDPPWGISVGKDLNLPKFYVAMLLEFIRVLKKNGLIVILIGKKEIFEEALSKLSQQLKLVKKYNILVSGKKASIYKIVNP